MDIGSGKVTRDKIKKRHIHDDRHLCDVQEILVKEAQWKKNTYFSEGIAHHLLDVASPKRAYNVTHFVRDAKRAIADIKKRGKTPIICGSAGFWIQALLEDQSFPAVKPDAALRKKLSLKSAAELFEMLMKKDPIRADSIDRHNKARLIRALEICQALGKVPTPHQSSPINQQEFCIIALVPKRETLHTRIEKRLTDRLENGMLEEVMRLHKTEGVSWQRLEGFGLEYRSSAQFLQKKISYAAREAGLLQDIKRYAKRQITWLRRFEKMGAHIHWTKDPREALKIVEKNTANS